MASTTVTNNNYYSGQGQVFVATRSVGGQPEGFRHVGNVSALSLGIAQEKTEHKNSTDGSRATDLVLTTAINGTLSMTMESLVSDNLSLAIFGTVTAVAGGSVVADSMTAYLGLNMSFGDLNVSAVTVTNVGATITYVEGDNYTLNPEAGSINFLTTAEQTAAGAANLIADLQALLVSYTFAGYNKTDALITTSKEVYLKFEGLNTVDSLAPVVIEVPRFDVAPLAELALINEEVAGMQIDGTILQDTTILTGSKYFIIKQIN